MSANILKSTDGRHLWALAGLAMLLALPSVPAHANDYPTSETVDYVIGCMAANGNTHQAMMKCSCSIDFIAKRIPFKQYELAETALAMQQGGGLGGRVGEFEDPPEVKNAIRDLHKAQAEANLQCFE